MTSSEKRGRYQTAVGTVSRTKQAPRDECDIRNIMAKYRNTGEINHLNSRTPQYGDFTKATDLLTAIGQVSQAQEDFMGLPAAVRAYCGNDPVTFMHALASENDRAALEDLGLVLGDTNEKDTAGEDTTWSSEENAKLTNPQLLKEVQKLREAFPLVMAANEDKKNKPVTPQGGK